MTEERGPEMRKARWYKFLLILFLCSTPLVLMFTVSGASGQEEDSRPAKNSDGGYVGEEQCAACHEDIATGWKKNVHAGKGFEMRSALACETCHGPGAAHVESGGDKTLIKSFKTMKASESSETCMGCHENGKQTM